ncbi:MAG: WD40 repeat domain-containing protein [Treponema sp.]|nr:WD40 repeat domain-containing protein [Treponema sp.]
MTKKRRKYWVLGGVILFAAYIFAAARPIPRETILVPQWLSSLESGYPVSMRRAAEEAGGVPEDQPLIPFRLGDRFGYASPAGLLPLNRIKTQNLFLSASYWAEYGAVPEEIEILKNTGERAFITGEDRAYPVMLEERLFLIGKDMDTLSALDEEGKVLWSHDFAAPLTCIDGAAGFILTGSLDGVVEILDGNGERFFFFEPGGSRLSVILGCSFSRDGNRLGIISGIDDQRFLLLERYGDPARGEFRVIYHEFLGDGFRRPVHIAFIDNDNRVAFERQGGLSIYDLRNRTNQIIPLEGRISVMDGEGSEGVFFLILSREGMWKELVAIELPGAVILRAPFRSDDTFLHRSGPRLYLGGGNVLAAFELEKR